MLASGTFSETQVIVLQDFGMQLLGNGMKIASVKTPDLFGHNFGRRKIYKLQPASLNSVIQDTEGTCRAEFSSCIYQKFDTFLSIKYDKIAVSSIWYLWTGLELDYHCITVGELVS